MESLRPCPFCGGEAKIQEYNGGFAAVGCSNGRCHMHSHAFAFGFAEDAIQKWNRRAERTCRPEVCDDGAGAWGVYCSECGYRFAGPYGKREVPEHMAGRRDIMPRYCPSCGARVTEVVRDGD